VFEMYRAPYIAHAEFHSIYSRVQQFILPQACKVPTTSSAIYNVQDYVTVDRQRMVVHWNEFGMFHRWSLIQICTFARRRLFPLYL
jgi:hypothetical protein